MVSLLAPLNLNKFKEDLVGGKKSHPAITQLAQKSKSHQINTIISSAVICGEVTQPLDFQESFSLCSRLDYSTCKKVDSTHKRVV